MHSIFEHQDSAADMLRLIVGKLPPSSANSMANTTLPVSPHYARLLAALAAERGFDGYLLNFEYALAGGPEQARALDAWIGMLEVELRNRVGPHAHAVW
jgi:mannosyl-glycoprotein endo-beta-N-acetylglucosaminidase